MLCIVAFAIPSYQRSNKVCFVEQRHILRDLSGQSVLSLLWRGNHHVMKPVTLHCFLLSLSLNSFLQLLLLHAELLQLPQNEISLGMHVEKLFFHLNLLIDPLIRRGWRGDQIIIERTSFFHYFKQIKGSQFNS